FADVVGGSERQFGTIIKIDAQAISIRPGCDAKNALREIKWDDVRYVLFDSQCDPHVVVPPSAGLAACNGASITVYQLRFMSGQSLDALEVAFDGINVRAKRSNGDWVVEKRDAVLRIVKTQRCQNAEVLEDTWP